mmetsp:Transcript_43995/g.104106  ORF Transcript_43995/g.104106 Transcript_43995/m.104106 type:complete len:739 (-) Transcript_43995:206-2422(-)
MDAPSHGTNPNGWERLLEAQSEYIANLQKMLQSACQNAAAVKQQQHQQHQLIASDGMLTTSEQWREASRHVEEVVAQRTRSAGSDLSGAEPGHDSTSNRGIRTDDVNQMLASNLLLALANSSAGLKKQAVQQSGLIPAASDQPSSARTVTAAQQLPQQQALSLPADEGAGRPAVVPAWVQHDKGDVLENVSTAPPSQSPQTPTLSTTTSSSSGTARVEEVANEVLRLRLQKSQFEELRGQLSAATGQMRRLAPHAVFQFRSYFERNLRDSNSASQIQEALTGLIECLCAICKVEVNLLAHEALLSTIRRLLRDPHNFTSKLANMPPLPGEEAKSLAPFLLSSTKFKRVREREVNECFDVFRAWIAAFYLYSACADQVGPVSSQLEKQEKLLQRLTGQVEELPRTSLTAPRPSIAGERPAAQASTRTSCGGQAGAAPRRHTSPIGGRQASVQGGPSPSRVPTTSGRWAVVDAESMPTVSSRPPSPAVRSAASLVRPGPSAGGKISPLRSTSPGRTDALHGLRPAPGEGLSRASSERTFHSHSHVGFTVGAGPAALATAGSPRTIRKESRSPSPGGAGRASPYAARPVLRTAERYDGRALTPSHSKGSLGAETRRSATLHDMKASSGGGKGSLRIKPGGASAATARHVPTSGSTATTTRGGLRKSSPPVSLAQDTGMRRSHTDHGVLTSSRDTRRSKFVNEDDIHSGDDEAGPSRRRLTAQEYEALVECARQVVAGVASS